MTVLLTTCLVLSSTLAIFLGKEFLKKFGFMADFIKHSNQMISYTYHGAKAEGIERSMQNIVLRGEKPFCALVGFRLEIPVIGYTGFDYYGFVRSDKNGVAVLSTFFGTGAVEFMFFVNTDLETNRVVATSSPEDQELTPSVSFPPHLYQRLGFYG